MASAAISLPDLEAFMAAKSRKLAFPGALEVAFQTHVLPYRQAVLRRIAVPAAVGYNLLLGANYLLVPDTFWLAVILHFAVVTPCIFLATFLYGLKVSTLLRNAGAASVPLTMLGMAGLSYYSSTSPSAQHFQYLIVVIVLFMNVLPRFSFRFASAVTATVAALYYAGLLAGGEALAVKVVGATLMSAVACLTLLANWYLERDLRYAFLTRLREQLRREGAEDDAVRDPLTGISNRRYLDETTEKLWVEGDTVSPIAMIMADLDHFKSYNDRYGHPAGDTCLKRVAGVISAQLRDDEDVAVRLGGEEFLVVMPRTDLKTAVKIAERIRRSIEALAIPHLDGGNGHIVTASLGVVSGTMTRRDGTDLIEEADEALYVAKRNGRNRIHPPFVATAVDTRPDDARHVA